MSIYFHKSNNNQIGLTYGQLRHSNTAGNEACKAMLTCHDKLITSLANDYLNIAGLLLAREFISDELSAKMLLPSLTPKEKATFPVTAIREKIKLDPQMLQFTELMKLFSIHDSTKCIVSLLQSAYKGEVRYNYNN